MKKYFIVVFSILLLSTSLDAKKKKKPVKKSYEQEQKVEKKRVNTMKYPLSKKAQDFEPKSEKKYGFEIRLEDGIGARGVMDLAKDLELLAGITLYYDYLTIESYLFYANSGIRYDFSKNKAGSSWYVSPMLRVGIAHTVSDNYFLMGVSTVFGYIWRWETFRLSLDLGPKYDHIFGDIGSKHRPFYGVLALGLGWSF
jgi:hypothetical protein